MAHRPVKERLMSPSQPFKPARLDPITAKLAAMQRFMDDRPGHSRPDPARPISDPAHSGPTAASRAHDLAMEEPERWDGMS